MVKNSPAKAGDIRDAGSIPGSGKSPGDGNGNPVQYSFPRTEEPAGIQSTGLQRLRCDLAACTTAYYVSLCICYLN